MKGFIIYENDLRAINAVKLKNASFCYESVEDDKTIPYAKKIVDWEDVR